MAQVIDAQGNMIALTPSGGVFRKSAFAPELGCTLSTRSEMFVLEDGHPNALAPGKRPRTTLVSYLIRENGAPVMTVGCPGGDDQAQANLQIVLNLVAFGMNPQEAVEAPRFATQTLVNSFYPRIYKPGQLNVESGILESTRAGLRAPSTNRPIGSCHRRSTSAGVVEGSPMAWRASIRRRIWRSRSLRARSITSGTSGSSGLFLSTICSTRLIRLSASHSDFVISMLDHDQPHRPSTSPRSMARLTSGPPG